MEILMRHLSVILLSLLVLSFIPSAGWAWQGKYTGVGKGSDGKLRVLKMTIGLRGNDHYWVRGSIYIRHKKHRTGLVKFAGKVNLGVFYLRDDEILAATFQSPVGLLYAKARSRYRFNAVLSEKDHSGRVVMQCAFTVKCKDKKCKKPLPPCTSGAFISDRPYALSAAKACVGPAPTPTPNAVYSIYSAGNCGGNIFIARPSDLTGIKKCSVPGCGRDCTTAVQFSPLAGPYSSKAAGQRALCSFLSAKWYNAMVPWGPYVSWGGTTHACFTSDCKGALSTYCPQL